MVFPPKLPSTDVTEHSLGFERLIFFSDAVYAIAITLLALEIRLPEVTPAELPQALLALLPEIGVYVLSFLIVGLYWVIHHQMFHYIERYDHKLIWLNLFFLLFIAFCPWRAMSLATISIPSRYCFIALSFA